MQDYDVIYIGSGNASWQGARFLSDAGMKILIIENNLYGGACANYGCNSKILLDAPFELQAAINRYEGIGKSGDFSVDWPSLMKYKQKRISNMPVFLDGKFKEYNLDVADGTGVLIDNHTVQVGENLYHADKIVISTGLEPIIPDIPGREYLKTSTDFLEIPELPKKCILIGGGFVSMEFASILAEYGSDVDIIIHSDKVLRNFYQPYVENVVEILKQQGVNFHYNEEVCEVIKDDDKYIVRTEDGLELFGDYIVSAMGRKPAIDELNLDDVGVEYSSRGIAVNGNMQTNIPNIYATGDVADSGTPKLVTVAIHQSKYLAKYLLGKTTDDITYPVIPAVVFTLPRIAFVGVRASDVVDNDDYSIHRIQYGKSYSIELKNEDTAEVTVITDNDLNIVGAEIYSCEAENVANLFAFIINNNISLEKLDEMIYAFPSSSSVLLYKLHNIHYKIGNRKEN